LLRVNLQRPHRRADDKKDRKIAPSHLNSALRPGSASYRVNVHS
jgi:hypothetical protein